MRLYSRTIHALTGEAGQKSSRRKRQAMKKKEDGPRSEHTHSATARSSQTQGWRSST